MIKDSWQWGASSNGRALALHARGTGIDAQVLHTLFHLLTPVSIAKVYPICQEPKDGIDSQNLPRCMFLSLIFAAPSLFPPTPIYDVVKPFRLTSIPSIKALGDWFSS